MDGSLTIMDERLPMTVKQPRRPPGVLRRALDKDLADVDTAGRSALVARGRLLADALDGARPDPKRQYLLPQLDRQYADALLRLGIGAVAGSATSTPWDDYLAELRRVEQQEQARAAAHRDAETS